MCQALVRLMLWLNALLQGRGGAHGAHVYVWELVPVHWAREDPKALVLLYFRLQAVLHQQDHALLSYEPHLLALDMEAGDLVVEIVHFSSLERSVQVNNFCLRSIQQVLQILILLLDLDNIVRSFVNIVLKHELLHFTHAFAGRLEISNSHDLSTLHTSSFLHRQAEFVRRFQ